MADGEIWERRDAENRIGEVFDNAKTSGIQRVGDPGGHFEIRYVPQTSKERATALLARGGPQED